MVVVERLAKTQPQNTNITFYKAAQPFYLIKRKTSHSFLRAESLCMFCCVMGSSDRLRASKTSEEKGIIPKKAGFSATSRRDVILAPSAPTIGL